MQDVSGTMIYKVYGGSFHTRALYSSRGFVLRLSGVDGAQHTVEPLDKQRTNWLIVSQSENHLQKEVNI